jgi:hypothetical protein
MKDLLPILCFICFLLIYGISHAERMAENGLAAVSMGQIHDFLVFISVGTNRRVSTKIYDNIWTGQNSSNLILCHRESALYLLFMIWRL